MLIHKDIVRLTVELGATPHGDIVQIFSDHTSSDFLHVCW